MRRICCVMLFSLLSCINSPPDAEKIQSELTTIINKQVEAWNSGSIEGFMAYYWNSEEFTFQSGENRILGWRTREDSASQGLFTILFKKLPEGWRIINDHSSSG